MQHMKKQIHQEWSFDGVIYEVNIRQYTSEGTFKAFLPHLDRLSEMGVDILWLMPVFPIGSVHRKGLLGSYYSIKDFKGVNPEFGNEEDLRALIEKAHRLGMKVLLDWVTNHAAWDNVWTVSHPEYFKKGEGGGFVSPNDWSDVIALDYGVASMRKAMIDAMCYWVREFDIDGFRCDVAGLVPVDFWEEARYHLELIKPLFMLAEDEENGALMRYAFDMNYTWKVHHMMGKVAKGEESLGAFRAVFDQNNALYPPSVYRMQFITNHDENSWNGSEYERLGEFSEAFAALTFMLPGMPLIYSGQEAGYKERIAFFDKDRIEWGDVVLHGLYQQLIAIKKSYTPLHNGNYGAPIRWIQSNCSDTLLGLARKDHMNTIIAFFHFGNEVLPQVNVDTEGYEGEYTDLLTGETVKVDSNWHPEIQPGGYQLLALHHQR